MSLSKLLDPEANPVFEERVAEKSPASISCANRYCVKRQAHVKGKCQAIDGVDLCAVCCSMVCKKFLGNGGSCSMRGKRGRLPVQTKTEVANRLAGLALIFGENSSHSNILRYSNACFSSISLIMSMLSCILGSFLFSNWYCSVALECFKTILIRKGFR